MDITALPPVFVVPLWLHVASFHPVITLVSFLLVPTSVMLYYLLVLRRRRRTQFFMSWGLVSTIYIYWVFAQHVLHLGHIGAAETAAISMLFLAMLGTFFLSKHGPGVVTKSNKKQDSSAVDWFRVSTNNSTSADDVKRLRSDSDSLQRRINSSDVISPTVNDSALVSGKTSGQSGSSSSSSAESGEL